MSTAAAPTPGLEVQEYAQAWGVSLASAQQEIPGAKCEIFTQAPPGASDADKQDLWITVTSQGDLGGALAFRVDRKTALRLSRASSSETADASAELTDENRTSLVELVRNAADLVKASVPHAGIGEFRVEVGGSGPEKKAFVLWLQLRADAGDAVCFELWLDNVIAGRLMSLPKAPDPSTDSAAGAAEAKLGMLMGVELSVTVRLGGRRMLLKDILDLCAGSVVELDQEVQEPVDLLLDGKLIARGEVVVVDGNYGLRVSEVLSGPAR